MTSASCEMDSSAALRANAISAFRSIMYCSGGAMLGYGDLASCACALHAALNATTNVKLLTANILRAVGLIDFSLIQAFCLSQISVTFCGVVVTRLQSYAA